MTLGIDLRVVLVEDGGVHAEGSGDFVAGVTLGHDVNSLTVFALISKTNSLLGHEVRALIVNVLVDDS